MKSFLQFDRRIAHSNRRTAIELCAIVQRAFAGEVAARALGQQLLAESATNLGSPRSLRVAGCRDLPSLRRPEKVNEVVPIPRTGQLLKMDVT